MQDQTDRILIMKYRAGDNSALPVLVQRYHRTFCEKAYWITKDRDLSKDIAQDSWITIIKKMNTLKNPERFKSWALRIIYTTAIDHIKHNKKVKTNIPSIIAIENEDIKAKHEYERIEKELLNAIRGLSKQKQDIIRLFYTEQYSIKEIGDFLNIPAGTVKSRLYNAREKLKLLLKRK